MSSQQAPPVGAGANTSNPAHPFVFPRSLNPVDPLAARFNHWRKVVRVLNQYFKEVAEQSTQTTRFHSRASQLLSDVATPAPGASATSPTSTTTAAGTSATTASEKAQQAPAVSAPLNLTPTSTKLIHVPGALHAMHNDIAEAASRVPQLVQQELIPRLQQVDRDIQAGLDRLRGASSSFRTGPQVKQVQGHTQNELAQYHSALEAIKSGKAPSTDPYLLRESVESHVGHQVLLENNLLDAYANVQQDAAEIDRSIVSELQTILNKLQATLVSIGEPQVNVAKSLLSGALSRDPALSFQEYIESEPDHFLSHDVKARVAHDLDYDGRDSPYARAVRKGTLERRTKYLKSFAAADYILTPSTLIELKSNQPVLGIDLTDAELDTDHKHSTGNRFVINAKQANTQSGKRHTWVFRADDAKAWVADIQKLLSAKTPEARCAAVFGASSATAAGHKEKEAAGVAAPAAATGASAGAAGPAAGASAVPAPVPAATAPVSKDVHPAAGAPIGSDPTVGAGTAGATSGEALGVAAGAAAGIGAGAGAAALASDKDYESVHVDPKDVHAEGGPVKADSSAGGEAALAAVDQDVSAPAFDRTVSEAPSTAALSTTAVKSVNVISSPVSEAAVVGGATAGAAGAAGLAAGGVEARHDTQALDAAAGGVPVAGFPVAGVAAGDVKARDSDEISSEVSELSGEGYRNLLKRADADPIDFETTEPHSAAWQAEKNLAVLGAGDAPTDGPHDHLAAGAGVGAAVGAVAGAGTAGATAGAPGDSAVDDRGSVFSYDLTHKSTTYEGEDFEPVQANIPPQVERRLTQTSHKYTDPAQEGIGAARTEAEVGDNPEEVLSRRRSSVSVNGLQRKPSRRATASYGDEMKPLTSGGEEPSTLFFADDLPKTTSSAAVE